MTDRPIIFSAPMVLALLDGRKTMTRRLAWREPRISAGQEPDEAGRGTAPLPSTGGRRRPSSGTAREAPMKDGDRPAALMPSPWRRVRPGDRLWVRENWRLSGGPTKGRIVVYSAGGEMRPDTHAVWEYGAIRLKWYERQQPSIHMPRWASRLTLVVMATKIERLQDISEADAVAEGVDASLVDETRGGIDIGPWGPAALMNFGRLWSTLHGPASWDANPEVVALTFTVHQRNIDAMKEAA